MSGATLSARVLEGDPRALARAISLIEDEAPAGAELDAPDLRADRTRLSDRRLPAPPGSGKSTLVDRLTAAIRATSQTVGIVAVDPTSPFSGGAILGDRVRMQAHAGDAGVFIRSMATRGHLGGLARATSEVALVLDASGKDVVIIETVGVGQDEIDIVRTADVSVVTIVPGTGDEVQALKAGIMEIADIFVVNKADREGADRTGRVHRGEPVAADVRAGGLASADREDGGDEPDAAFRTCSMPSSGFARIPRRRGAHGVERGPSSGCARSSRSASFATSSSECCRWRVRSNPRSDRGARGRSIHRGRATS